MNAPLKPLQVEIDVVCSVLDEIKRANDELDARWWQRYRAAQQTEHGCFCGDCGEACEAVLERNGVNKDEAFGVVSYADGDCLVSSCCGADVYADSELQDLFEGD